MVRRGGMGYKTSAQKKRSRERRKSIRKQQSKGITNPNTDRYNNWGLPRGAKPPSGQDDNEIQATDGIIVKKSYLNQIIEHVGEYKRKSFGYTAKSFPVYQLRESGGEWRLEALMFRMDSRGLGDVKRDLFVRTEGFPDSDKPDSPPSGGVEVARFETKKAAMEYLDASGSIKSEHRYRDENLYTIQGRHLPDDYKRMFAVTNDMRDTIYDHMRGGVYRRCNRSRSHSGDGVPDSNL